MTANALDDAILRAETHAPYLRGLIRREPELLEMIRYEGPDAALAATFARLDPESPGPSLRASKGGMALVVALADLAGLWPLEQVTASLSRHADRALDFAITAAFAERGAVPSGLIALALGKLGSRELNYSSDIDLIFLHDPEKLPLRTRDEDPTEAAVRIVRRVSTLLSDRTEHGYCWRVDLRLRPDPDSTSSSLPLSAAEQYYQSQALAWERLAFIRARPVAGDLQAGAAFLEQIDPFIWRRSLDYSALADIREVSYRIRDHFSEGQKLGPGFDLKRGRGGIREIEFFAQTQQLIFGGRDPSLRAAATMEGLAALAQGGRIPPEDAEFLSDAYRRLRTLEHRVQMIADQQTHTIPKLKAERDAIARLMAEQDWKAVEGMLSPWLRGVARHYDQLLASGGDEKRGPRIPLEPDSVTLWAKTAKIADPVLLTALVAGWRNGRLRSLRTDDSRRVFESVAPALVSAVGKGRNGREGLLRLDRMISALPSGVQLWRLLAANPGLVDVVGRVLTATPLLADALARRPDLIDVLIEPASPSADIDAARAELALATAGLDGELLLDRVRRYTAEYRFQLGVQLLDGSVTPLAAAATLGFIAEATVELLADQVQTDFAKKYGEIPDSRLVVLALGRFGGGELTTQSDLDLVFTYTGSFEQQSVGGQSLSASTWYNRVGQRLVAALTVPTAAGHLYEVDTRLRPSGADGLLVPSLDSFERYQRETAEIWELMALTRARPITGSPADRARVERILDDLIAIRRDPAKICAEVLSLRRYLTKNKPASGPFDVKLVKGGLVDIEFILQARSLIEGKRVSPAIAEAAAELAPELMEPARFLLSVLVMLRLIQPHDSRTAPMSGADAALARACGYSNVASLREAYADVRATVNAAWKKTFGTY
ncbi:MAG: bifunctional [glutamine synthetase] adenylyltransferase/[glutamine synthetase]-adenylyl-L-tyrosine phosphorylase [Sphingomonadaceae bacterium]